MASLTCAKAAGRGMKLIGQPAPPFEREMSPWIFIASEGDKDLYQHPNVKDAFLLVDRNKRQPSTSIVYMSVGNDNIYRKILMEYPELYARALLLTS